MSLNNRNSSWSRDKENSNIHLRGDPLAIIYNEGMWRLNKVSPLYKLKYSPVKMKHYASRIKQAIVSAVQASTANYTVVFEELPNLKYSEDDASGIMISVTSTTEKTSKVAYDAVLLSWGMMESVDKAIHLPYMLERGEQRIGTAVQALLQTLFDCNIRQFTFTQHQLLQFGFNLVDCDTPRSTDPCSLVYKTPHRNEKLSVSFEVGDISLIWNIVKDEAMKQTEMINMAYQILQKQILDTSQLDIIMFDLSEVIMPKGVIKSNGAVKMRTPEIVNCVFTVLNDITSFQSKDYVNTIMDEE